MNAQCQAADRGTVVDVEAPLEGPRWWRVARTGSLRHRAMGTTVWLQLRGVTRVAAREGVFELRRGDWLVLERDSCPELQADRHGLTLGLTLAPPAAGERRRSELLPGLGWLPVADRRIALRLWRNGAEPQGIGQAGARQEGAKQESARFGRGPAMPCEERAHAIQAAVAYLSGLQGRLDEGIARCPGRSVARKRQVFARLQRARLFLQGHSDRVVRLSELAALASFSSWYLSKTFHEIYRESPQSASVRLRLERACALLVGSDCAIGEVGVACGFDNSCSFARAFRARYGLTASDYRHAHLSMHDRAHSNDVRRAIGEAGDSRNAKTHLDKMRIDKTRIDQARVDEARVAKTRAEKPRAVRMPAEAAPAGRTVSGVFGLREADRVATDFGRTHPQDAARRDSVASAKLGTGCEPIRTRDSSLNALV